MVDMAMQQENLASAIVGFCRFARACGLSAAVKESVDALEAARTVGVGDREILKVALRAVLCSSRDEWNEFDEIFDAFWNAPEAGAASRKPRRKAQQGKQRETQNAIATLIGNNPGRAAEED